MEFSTRVRVMRTARGMSQLDLADAVKVSNRDLSYIETGKMLPTPEIEAAIRQVLRWGPREDEALNVLAESAQ
jgi:transcriptional regulator with XRE-family HTH domain